MAVFDNNVGKLDVVCYVTERGIFTSFLITTLQQLLR